MKRILSIWLTHWPIDRLRRRLQQNGGQPHPCEPRPFALVLKGAKGLTLHALNPAAEAEGLTPGMPLADARARLPSLLARPADPEEDRAALTRLALWCQRFSPLAAPAPPDGLLLDLAGVSHLFGGEAKALDRIKTALNRLGFGCRLALAPTIGAAHALARFDQAAGDAPLIVTAETLRARIFSLPPAALRIEDEMALALNRFGLKTIGALAALPRATLARRFKSLARGAELMSRLDEALGHRDEPLRPLEPVKTYRTEIAANEPIGTHIAIEAALERLAPRLAALLLSDGLGATRLDLDLYRVDGERLRLTAGASLPTQDARHIAALFKPRLEGLETGFGIDLIALGAAETAPFHPVQEDFAGGPSSACGQKALAELIDRFATRLGPRAIERAVLKESHIPERAEAFHSALALPPKDTRPPAPPRPRMRPFRLFERPEPIGVMAEVPDGPPLRFTWRRVPREVARARGPERIAPEWWTDLSGREAIRDYYEIEDTEGRRYWVFRAGLYGAGGGAPPQWYVHGLFG